MDKIIFFDSTLRDGSHAIGHQLKKNDIKNYCKLADSAGLYTIIVGHGNGLGASSLQIGISGLQDKDMLKIARQELKRTKLGAFFIPGFGTIKDDIAPALDLGVDLMCVACHCTEADVTQQHIKYIRKMGKEAYGVLMMHHMTNPKILLQEAKKMQDYGAMGVIIMDSAGASTPEIVSERVKLLTDNLNIRVGFHAHNNLGMAVSNSYSAIKAGASIIDATISGFGAGAGNCQLEVLAGLLQKVKIETGLNLYKLTDLGDNVILKIMQNPQTITSSSLISGLAGVFSGFAPHVKKAAKRFCVDPRDIFFELGKRKIIAGQEDFIIDVAMQLSKKNKKS